MSRRLAALWSDARHAQILALSTLLIYNFGWLDFGARPLNSACAIGGALAMQVVCSRWLGLPIDLRSPLITGLSLSLLLRADDAWLPAAAGALAILSKFALRLDGKHVFNPAGFAIVALLLATNHVWISPGQWGAALWFAALVSFLAILVLQAARRADIALFFLASHAAFLLARAAWLGDPWAIPLHQMQSGSLLIFAFFMISDPRTSPDSRVGRLAFALAVAALGHWLAFFMQMRPALYIALIALSPLTILLDRIMPAKRFAWTAPAQQGAVP
jgi:Na+-transporting NADH:ubiquinone oxidoreductase subunit NqrB